MATGEASAKGFKYSDIIVVCAVIFTVILMIVPIPTALLDFLLTINISVSLIIIIIAMYNKETLDFAVFPTLLLVMTLFRLSLNVSSTRLILLKAEAGNIIETFGNFVIGGEPVVGFVIFLILVVIQFLVITKGAERVSEVAARFTLDAMPGKQMSIDADLNAGLINDIEAKERRVKIQREADFYGAMDGASKFVKGDAIASIVITIINVTGGFIIGLVQGRADSATEVLSMYTTLSVGDGLVSQIPALLISVATGIVVTRSASESNFGQDLVNQLFSQPRVLAIASGMLVILALLGLPPIPLLALAIVLGFSAYAFKSRSEQAELDLAEQEMEQEVEDTKKPENVLSLLHVDVLELELGYSLIPLVDTSQGGDLLDRVIMIRRQTALEMGLVLPPIRMRDNMQLKPNSYVVKIKGVEVANGTLMIDHYLAMSSGIDDDSIQGIDTFEPAFGLPAKWIPSSLKEHAEMSGYTVVDPPSVIATHITEIIKSHAYEILGRQDVKSLVDNLKENYPAVVEELIPDTLTIGEIQKVLANLLKERVPIRDLVTIFETLADYATMTKDIDMLTEYVRQALGRQISKIFAEDGIIQAITLDPQLEQSIRDSIQRTEQGSYLAIEPQQAQKLYRELANVVEKVSQMGVQPIVLCAPVVRIYFKQLTERVIPNLVVLSYNELEGNVQVQSVGMVSI